MMSMWEKDWQKHLKTMRGFQINDATLEVWCRFLSGELIYNAAIVSNLRRYQERRRRRSDLYEYGTRFGLSKDGIDGKNTGS